MEEKTIRICEKHLAEKWTLFARDGWVYAVDLAAESTVKGSKEPKGGKHKRH